MAGPYLNTGVFQTAVTANDTSQKEELGCWRFEAGKVYRYVRSGAIIPGYEAVQLDNTTTTAALLGNQVVQSNPTFAVVGIAETTLASGNYGWITVYGPATARVITNTIPGMSLQAGGGVAGGATGVLGISNTIATQVGGVIGIAVQTGLSAGSAIFIRAL